MLERLPITITQVKAKLTKLNKANYIFFGITKGIIKK